MHDEQSSCGARFDCNVPGRRERQPLLSETELGLTSESVENVERQRILAELEEVHQLRERMLQEGVTTSSNIYLQPHLQTYACSAVLPQVALLERNVGTAFQCCL